MEVPTISFGSKYFGWLAALAIVVLVGWFTLPTGYNTLVLWLAPQFGNYVRPTIVMVNLLLVSPLTGLLNVAIWAGAGLVGGMIAGTKKGAFVVGLVTWLSTLVILVFCAYMMFIGGIELGSFPPLPPGSSLTDILTIPLVQAVIGDLLNIIGLVSGGGGGIPNIMTLIMPLLVYIFTPVITVIVAAIIGAVIRPKE